jgi:hypothetical protein
MAVAVAPATPIFSKAPPKAMAVAGPPVNATEPARMPNLTSTPRTLAIAMPIAFCRTAPTVAMASNSEHLHTAFADELHAGAEPDAGHKCDHQEVPQGGVRLYIGPAPVQQQSGHRADHAAGDRNGNVSRSSRGSLRFSQWPISTPRQARLSTGTAQSFQVGIIFMQYSKFA